MRLFEDLRRDLILAFRGLARRPTFTATVVATLALGIGANTAVFSVVDAVLLRPLPYPAPERLLALWAELPKQGRMDAHLSGPELAAIWEGATALEAMGAVWSRPGVLRGDGRAAEEVEVGWITPGFLEALGARAALGRLPTREELVADPSDIIVLSHALWQSRYGADPAIVGRTIDFDDERRMVVGVLPPGFRLHLPPDQAVPEELAAFLPWGGDANAYREMPRAFRVFTPVARLAPKATLAQAATELGAVAEHTRAQSADYASSGLGLRAEPLAAGVVSPVRATLLILLGVATLLLVVACANVANLALVRAKDAERELRVRAALGASRARLLRLLLAESLVLGAAGAAAGLVLAGVGLDLLRALEPGRLPRLAGVALHPRVLAYTGGLTLLTSLVFGGLAAAAAVASALSASLQDPERMATGRSGRLRPALVIGQLAVSLVLATGALLLVRSFAALQAVDPGFEPRGVLTARLSLPDVHYRYRDQGPKIASFYRRLDERLRALPGVQAAGATTAPPLSGAAIRSRPYAWRAPGGETEWGRTAADYSTVTPGWFDAAGVRRLAGRAFTDADGPEQPLAVVVDDALARAAWGSVAGAVGQPIRVEVFRDASFQPRWGEVVGVIGTVRLNRLEAAGREQVYLAHTQAPQRTMYPTLRTTGDPYALLPAIQREVAALEKDLPVFEARLATAHVATATAMSRFALATLGAFAAVALLLAAAGVYAVMAHSVGRRRYEIGVRLALGATPRRINALVLGQGMGVAAIGIACGILAALAATRVLSGLLFGVAPRDAATLAVAALLTSVAALAACAAPAWRAARLSPREALDH
jgi:predicted permease